MIIPIPHLTMSAPECYEKLGTFAQMNPPIRDKSHQDRLWYGVKNNFSDIIGSDHAPHSKENKEKIYPNSPSGMPGVQTLVPVMLNHVNDGKLTLQQFINFVCENPVKIFGIKNKGFIKKSYDADLTIVDMNKIITIKNENIESKCKWSPFNGEKFRGTPVATIINGKIKIGLTNEDIEILAQNKNIDKVSRHNFIIALNNQSHAATTVSSTIYIASSLGIKFFSTGGIGGVHLEVENTFDISADLYELSKTNMFVICSGAKSILDLDKTYEHLETL